MIKVFRFLAICTIGVALATSSIAWAQTYTTINFPGAVATTLNGGPDPQGTSVGSWTDTGGVIHGFTLSKKGVFTSFDPPGSTLTTPNFISPQKTIVGGYNDSASVAHGFILDGGQYTTLDFPGAAGTQSHGSQPLRGNDRILLFRPGCGSTGNPSTNHSFSVSKHGAFTSFDPPGRSQQHCHRLIRRAQSSVLTSIVVERPTDTCCTTGRSPRLIFRALPSRLPGE